MKSVYILTILGVLFLGMLVMTSCKSKSVVNDPTVLEIEVLAELEDNVKGIRLQKELTEFEITDVKATNMTLNQYLYRVILKGQTSNELLRAFNAKSYVKSAVIAPRGDGPAKNMPPGKRTKTSPIKG